MKQLRNDLYAIRGWFGWVHLLVEEDELTLLDTGLFGDFRRVKHAIAALGRKPADLRTILLTHGHLDHTSNADRLHEWCGAKVFAPSGDELHVQGRYPYRGRARICGGIEACGRLLMRYRPPAVNVWVKGGERLPFWGGLQVIALPGHTAGHVGYYSASKRVLFTGDLFAVHWRVVLPPPFLNTDKKRLLESIKVAAAIDADWFIPAHYFRISPGTVFQFKTKFQNVSLSEW
jgi:glyoxylase-like metal-dependent hydrolase (beta-lactamase superfamily II)